MSRVPVLSDPLLAEWAARAFDRERKLLRALVALGPIAERDVTLAGTVPPWLVAELRGLGARIAEPSGDASLGPSSTDVVIGAWSAFREDHEAQIAQAVTLLRPEGRLLVIHDYGRDEIDDLLGDRPESTTWSRRGGPFTEAGFKIHVVHCWWAFESLEDAAGFLHDAFGDTGAMTAGGLRRPRLSHNVAIYHRDAVPA